MPIKQLPDESSVSILSSSSIFSPVSAIKELIDNSIDSGATSITIEVDLDTVGLNFLSVKDNGSGINKSDRPSVCLKSTTSKVSKIDEISMSMSSLGFRGEALFFLANLSCKFDKHGFGTMSLSSRTEKDPLAEQWSVNAKGEIIAKSVRRIPAPQGTTISIKGLFNRLPVRKKFLIKKRSQLMSKLREMIVNYAFIYCHKTKFILKYVKLNSRNEVTSAGSNFSNANNGNLIINSNKSYFNILTDLTSVKDLKNQFILGIEETFYNEKELDQVDIGLRENSHGTGEAGSHGTVQSKDDRFDWKVTYLLPIMKAEHNIVSYHKSIKTLAINDRPMNILIGFGRKLNKVLASWYSEHQLLPPNIWYLNIKTPLINPDDQGDSHRILGDINIEPEKSDILLNGEEIILSKLAIYFTPKIRDAHEERSRERFMPKNGATSSIENLQANNGATNKLDNCHSEVEEVGSEVTKQKEDEPGGKIFELAEGFSSKTSLNRANITTNDKFPTQSKDTNNTDVSRATGTPDNGDRCFSMHHVGLSDETNITNDGEEEIIGEKKGNTNEKRNVLSQSQGSGNEGLLIDRDISISNAFTLPKLQTHTTNAAKKKSKSTGPDSINNNPDDSDVELLESVLPNQSPNHSLLFDNRANIHDICRENRTNNVRNDAESLAAKENRRPSQSLIQKRRFSAQSPLTDFLEELSAVSRNDMSSSTPNEDLENRQIYPRASEARSISRLSPSSTTNGATKGTTHTKKRRSASKLQVQHRQPLSKMFENTHCYTCDYAEFDAVAKCRKNFKSNFDFYEADMVDHETNFRNFLLGAHKKLNYGGCKVKVVEKRQGWKFWQFE